MPKMVALTSIKKDGNWLEIGRVHDFTDEEVEQLKGQQPPAIRYPTSDYTPDEEPAQAAALAEEADAGNGRASGRGKGKGKGKPAADPAAGL